MTLRKVHQQLSDLSALSADISDNCWWRYPHGLGASGGAAQQGARSPVGAAGETAGSHLARVDECAPGGQRSGRTSGRLDRDDATDEQRVVDDGVRADVAVAPRSGSVPDGDRRTYAPRRSPATRRRPRSRPTEDGRTRTPKLPSPIRSCGPWTNRPPRCVAVRNRLGAAATGRTIRSSCSTSPGYRSCCARPTPRISPRFMPFRNGRREQPAAGGRASLRAGPDDDARPRTRRASALTSTSGTTATCCPCRRRCTESRPGSRRRSSTRSRPRSRTSAPCAESSSR